MKLASFDALVAALHEAGVRYLVAAPALIRMKEAADRPQDRIDIEYLKGKAGHAD